MTENGKQHQVERKKSSTTGPLLQKDPKTSTWKYVTTLQIPEIVENSEETGKDNEPLPAMDDVSFFFQLLLYPNFNLVFKFSGKFLI